MIRYLKTCGRALSSLRLTVVLLGLGMVLIFFGTLDQVHLGIHAAQAKYFRSLFVSWRPAGTGWSIPVFPGGYLIGTLLFMNLVAAHGMRFKLAAKKIGIFFIHAGVVVLLLGELFTGLFAKESMMRMDIGTAQTYSEAPRESELAVIDTSSNEDDLVVAIPESLLARATIRRYSLPRRPIVRGDQGVDVRQVPPCLRSARRHAGSPPGREGRPAWEVRVWQVDAAQPPWRTRPPDLRAHRGRGARPRPSQ